MLLFPLLACMSLTETPPFDEVAVALRSISVLDVPTGDHLAPCNATTQGSSEWTCSHDLLVIKLNMPFLFEIVRDSDGSL